LVHFRKSRDSLVSNYATGWTTGVQFSAGVMMGFFLLATASRPALGPTQHPIKFVPGRLLCGVNEPRREADHLPPPNSKIKYAWRYITTPTVVLDVGD